MKQQPLHTNCNGCDKLFARTDNRHQGECAGVTYEICDSCGHRIVWLQFEAPLSAELHALRERVLRAAGSPTTTQPGAIIQ